MSHKLLAAVFAKQAGKDKEFATHKDFVDAIWLDESVEDFLLMNAANLLDKQWCFPRLRGVSMCENRLVVRCRMGGGNRECECYRFDDGEKCEACTIDNLHNHPLFISDEDEEYDYTYNQITFGPVDGQVLSLEPFKAVSDGNRAFKCPNCEEVMEDRLLRPYPYACCREIVAWLEKHSKCAASAASAASEASAATP